MSKVFLYKDNLEDRDCCAYIDSHPMRWECKHYFGSVNLEGACYSGHDFPAYEDIRTILTQPEYEALIDFSKEIDKLGYGITKGDERYQKGVELCKAIQPVYDKLTSEENEEFFKTIQLEEREYLMNEYGLDDADIDKIFDNYGLDYRDRAVVGCVFQDIYDCGYEEAWSLGYIDDNSIVARYFDFEKFGEDLINDRDYVLLDDGKVVRLNY